MSTPRTKPDSSNVEACKALFGRHPDDVLIPIETASNTLFQLTEIIGVIAEVAEHIHAPGITRICRLAAAGRYLASDIANFIDGEHEQMCNRIRAGDAAKEKRA